MDKASRAISIRRFSFPLFAIILILICLVCFFSSCEREEDVSGNNRIIPTLLTGEPVTVNFTVSDQNTGTSQVSIGSTTPFLASRSWSFSYAGELERVSGGALYIDASLIEDEAPVRLRSSYLEENTKVRVVAYNILLNDTIWLGYADYKIVSGGSLVLHETPPMTVPSGNVLFVAYSFNDTITMPAFAETTSAIASHDLLWGDTLETVGPGNANVHIMLDHWFSHVRLQAELSPITGNDIDTIFGARVGHTFPALTVRSGDLPPGTSDFIPFTYPSTGSTPAWNSNYHPVYTNGNLPTVVIIDSVKIDGTIYSGPYTINYYSMPLAPGKEYTLYARFTHNHLIVNPDSLDFTWDNTTVPGTVTVTTNQSNWTVTGVPGWLTVTPQSGSGNGFFTVAPNSNNSGIAPRTATLTVTAGALTQTVVVTQDFSPETMWAVIPYVGAFWRWNQVGERVIYSAHIGPWTATVENPSTTGAFVRLGNFSGVTDPNFKTNSPGNAESYPVSSGVTTLSGTGHIAFRIGLTGTLGSAATAPRYARVIVTWSGGTSYLYIRQGEAADYLMRAEEPGTSWPNRPNAVKWKPYNLTIPISGTWNADVGYQGGADTEYPTQAGAHFQWANAMNPRYAWAPTGAVSGWDLSYPVGQFWNTLAATHETCPPGYRRPNDGSIGSNASGTVIPSEIRQSLYLDPPTVFNHSDDNSIFGFYADGFFDRRPIVIPPADISPIPFPISVSVTNNNIAAAGRLFYNPNTQASLFFPASGIRLFMGGSLYDVDYMGAEGNYWSSSTEINQTAWKMNHYFYSYTRVDAGDKSYHGLSIRCVCEPDYFDMGTHYLWWRDQPLGYSWYEYANVPYGDNSSALIPPAGPQRNPPHYVSCAALPTTDPTKPWRLPTHPELQTIAGYMQANGGYDKFRFLPSIHLGGAGSGYFTATHSGGSVSWARVDNGTSVGNNAGAKTTVIPTFFIIGARCIRDK